MATHLYCGLNIVSNIAIPELPRTNSQKSTLFFNLEDARSLLLDPPWLHHWLSPSGEKLLSYWKNESYLWLRFPRLADMRISTDAGEILCFPEPGVPQETIRHLLLDQVLPRCLAHQGMTMLHASAVKLEQGLIIFIGDSGSGKSTLAGNFHQSGDLAVSDDCLCLKQNDNELLAVPSYGGLRLWEDSLDALFPPEQASHSMAHYSQKKRIELNGSAVLQVGEGFPVLAMIVLSSADQMLSSKVTLERLPHREAFIAMLKQTFQLDLRDVKRIKRHVLALGSVVPIMRSFRLSMPRDYAVLPFVRRRILEAVL